MKSDAHDVEPLLSICIPTLNRAALLDDALLSIRAEVASLGDEVEVVVSDNASTDDTAEVLNRHGDWVRWSTSEHTTGFCANIMRAACDLARGRFVWLVGDDDLVIRGGITRIVESLRAHPGVAYHYVNFGWVDVEQRHRIIHERDSVPPDKGEASLAPGTFQCDDLTTKLLPRIEDLVDLPGRNPSALFSVIFCFVAHRDLFLAGRPSLRPSDSLDGSSTLIDDHFPHAKISVAPMAGKPVGYIGQPCVLQGIGGWEWGAYEYKNMILGTYQLFSWLAGTSFAPAAMAKLWESYYDMAGRLFARMLYYPDDHKGLELVLDSAIPAAAAHETFWRTLMTETELSMTTDHDARELARRVEAILIGNPGARVGLWGILGRGHRFVKLSPHLHANLVWVTDRNPALHGINLDGTDLHLSSPADLAAADLDILVLGTRAEFVDEVTDTVTGSLKPGAAVVSVNGTTVIGKPR